MALCSHYSGNRHSSKDHTPTPHSRGPQGTIKHMPLFLCSEALPKRQSQEVWKAFTQLCAPPHHSDFIRQALWLRLPVGERQKNRKPHEVWCPHDG